MNWSRTMSKRNRFHNNVSEFLDDLNGRTEEELAPLVQWLGLKGPVKFESTESTERDFGGIDFVIKSDTEEITAQDKLRQRKGNSQNASSGKDIGIEIIRMYGFRHKDDYRIVPDYGRDLFRIPPHNVLMSGTEGKYKVKREHAETEMKSDLYVIHPVKAEHAVWCRSKTLRSLALQCAKKFVVEYARNESLRPPIKESFRSGGSKRIDNIFGQGNQVPDGVQMYVGKDVDQKMVHLEDEGSIIMASISKIIIYIPPHVLGTSGGHYLTY